VQQGDASSPSSSSKAEDQVRTSSIAGPPAVRIERLVLCRRVEGFGRYTPLSSMRFLAGRPAQAVIYTEVQGFADQPSSKTAGEVSTELGQTVELWLDADGTKQLAIPEQVVRESTRTRRRDYFLVQRLILPPTLSVGRYNLKVRVRDVVTGTEAERGIAIEIVADSSVLVGENTEK
jgi:hypothetical protein